MRITFAPGTTESGGWPPAVPGDGSHVHAFWGTEPRRHRARLVRVAALHPAGPLHRPAPRRAVRLRRGRPLGLLRPLLRLLDRRRNDSTRRSNWLDPLGTGQHHPRRPQRLHVPRGAHRAPRRRRPRPTPIQVTWNAVAGATGYNVYRAVGACPQTSYTQIATNVAGHHLQRHHGLAAASPTPTSCGPSWPAARRSTATAPTPPPPAAARRRRRSRALTSATSAGTPACAINLAWSAATPTCPGTTVKYNVYRSTTRGDPAERGHPAPELPDHAQLHRHHGHQRDALLLHRARGGQPDHRHRRLQQRHPGHQRRGAQRGPRRAERDGDGQRGERRRRTGTPPAARARTSGTS